MAEEVKQEQVDTQVQAETKPEAIDADKIKAEISKEFEKELKGLNRRNSELEAQLKKIESEKLTEEEKRVQQFEKEKREILGDYANAKIESLGFENSEVYIDLIAGNSKDEINKRVEIIKGIKSQIETPLLEKIKQLENQLKIKQAEQVPPSGGQGAPSVKLSLEEIEKLPTQQARIKALEDNGYRQKR